MRIIYLFSLTISLFLCERSVAQSNPDKLVAHFPFKTARIFDETGNNSSGAILGDTAWACGVQDSAFRFKPNSGILLVGPVSDVFTTSDFTVQFYIKPDASETGAKVIMSKQENCDTKNAFFIRYSKFNSGNKAMAISSGISENDNLLAVVQATLDKDRCWHHVAIVRSNTKFQLYVNGVLRDTKTSAGRINLSSNAPLELAQPVCPEDKGFVGDIDDLRFHSKALTADDVLRYYGRPDQIMNDDTVVYLGSSVQIRTTARCLNAVKWVPGMTAGVSNETIAEPVIKPVMPTQYVVQFIKEDGCRTTDTIFINVVDPDTLDCNKIFIPNAFTPGNSPGRNDVFGISNPFSVQEFVSFEIFDRWGGRMFSAVEVTDTWDGNFNNQPVNPGLYLYRLRYKCRGEEKVKSGSLSLLR